MDDMFFINIRLQIAATCFLLIILYDYIRRRKLPILSTRFFSLMLGCTCLNMVFDIATVYTVTHLDAVPPFVNRLFHQIFIGSLDALIYFMYLYIGMLIRQQERYSRTRLLLLSLPFLISMGVVVFGPLYYYRDVNVAYSYGPMATTVYISVAFYMLLINRMTFRVDAKLTRRKKISVLIGTTLWICTAIVQFFLPGLLLSGLAVVLLIFFVYLSFVNPTEHIDRETECFNRGAFHLILSEMISSKKQFAIVNVVLSDLTQVNRRFGHEIGSLLLSEVGSYCMETFGGNVFHYRGNALAAIDTGDIVYLEGIAGRISERFEKPWHPNGMTVHCSCRADVLLCPRYGDTPYSIYETLDYMFEDTHPDAAVRFADDALMDMKRRHTTVERLVEDAISNDGLDVVYQPIYSASAGRYVSAEALVRLRNREAIGYVPPDEFIPVVEHKGMIAQLGETVLRKVCAFADLADLRGMGLRYIEINLSGMQMVDPELPERMAEILKGYGTPPAFVNFEVTESVAIESGEVFAKNMRRLREMGSSFSMDDFGTGFSNLSQLAEASYDLIKIDKSLIWPCFEEEAKKPNVVLESVIGMVRRLDTPIVAEGVETEQQARFLIEMGVEYLQGYYFSRPLSEADFIKVLRDDPPVP